VTSLRQGQGLADEIARDSACRYRDAARAHVSDANNPVDFQLGRFYRR